MSLLFILVIYALFKFLNNQLPYKERKRELIERFQEIRSLSIKLQETVSKFILTNSANDIIFFENTTYGSFLKSLQKNHILYLSEKSYIKVKKSNNRFFLKKTDAVLNNQATKLKEAQNKVSGLYDS